MKPIFTTKVTVVPADWANSVTDLVYDVFHQATTLQEVKRILGVGSVGSQNVDNVNLLGGAINNVIIGALAPAAANFTTASVVGINPTLPTHLTSKHYVDTAIVNAIGELEWKDMAQQRSSAVNITGGAGLFDALRSRNGPVSSLDVVTLGWLQANGAGMAQATAPITIEPDNRTLNTPFPAIAGRCAIFVDGLYQLPDTYTILGPNQIRFITDLPAGSIVGGFRV